jgi:hypothetical protein
MQHFGWESEVKKTQNRTEGRIQSSDGVLNQVHLVKEAEVMSATTECSSKRNKSAEGHSYMALPVHKVCAKFSILM